MGRKIRVGINGFGRIGRAIFRVGISTGQFEVKAINDLNPNVENLAYLMKYDSIHGILPEEVEADGETIVLDGNPIPIYHQAKIQDVPWNDCDVEVVIGCTGNLDNVDNAKLCIGSSVKKVVFSDSPAAVDHTFVFGVSDKQYDQKKHDSIACSICDVVGLVPALLRLDEEFGVASGFLLTLHPWLFYQNTMDGRPNSPAFMDKPWTHHAIGRASFGNLIPKNTSLVTAIERVLPQMKGKFDGMSFRVPTDLVGSGTATVEMEQDVTTEEIKKFLRDAECAPYLGYTEDPLVSIDYKHHPFSCVVDGKWIEVKNKRFLRFVTWYDNEWGYSSRLVDAVRFIAERF